MRVTARCMDNRKPPSRASPTTRFTSPPSRLLSIASILIALVACGSGQTPTHLQPGNPAAEVWSAYRGDLQRDGHPATATLNRSEAEHLELAWRANLGGAVDGSPAVSNGLVVAASQSGRIAAYSSESGGEIWAVNGLGPITDSPAISGDTVLVASLSGHLYAFSLHDGTRLWDWKAPGIQPALWSSPAVYGGRVLIGVGSQAGDTPLEIGRMAAVDLTTGKQVWTMCVTDACAPGGGIWSTPAIAVNGHAFVGVGNPEDGVLAFDAATARRLWNVSFYPDAGKDLDVGESPLVLQFGGKAAVAEGSVAGVFKLLDAATGSVIWSRGLVNGSAVHGLVASPAYDGSSIYVPSASPPNGIFALAPPDGRTRWQHTTDQPIYSSPAVGDGTLVFGTGAFDSDVQVGSIVALSTLDGGLLWAYDAHSAVLGSPSIAGKMVAIGDSNGDLLVFRPSS